MLRKSSLRGLLSSQEFNSTRSSTLSLSQSLTTSTTPSPRVASGLSVAVIEKENGSARMALSQECKNPHVLAPYKGQNRQEQKEAEIDVEYWRPGYR